MYGEHLLFCIEHVRVPGACVWCIYERGGGPSNRNCQAYQTYFLRVASSSSSSSSSTHQIRPSSVHRSRLYNLPWMPSSLSLPQYPPRSPSTFPSTAKQTTAMVLHIVLLPKLLEFMTCWQVYLPPLQWDAPSNIAHTDTP